VFPLGKDRQKILIVDDSEMNRSILTDILDLEYDIIEAENGLEAVAELQRNQEKISLVLLDVVMPEMDGFGVLRVMNEQHWIENVPVVMISAEKHSSWVDQAYELGVVDFISRPFDAQVVHRRAVNTILLYDKQAKLKEMVAEQIYEKEQSSSLMVDILSHIVEFRNGESGMHVLHVRTLTEMLLRRLIQKTDRYALKQEDIAAIGTASALHDVGKIAIDERILNKPGRLSAEEFSIMKTHTTIGAEMLKSLPYHQEHSIVRLAYQICRWHHERYNGRGYPDGLEGENIPIAAQVVALADVYDALTSERVYKKAFSHEKALEMISCGECGAFSPLMLDCLRDISDQIRKEFQNAGRIQQRELKSVSHAMSQHRELSASHRTLQLLELERMKYNFFAAMSQELQFEYTVLPPMVTLNTWGAERLGMGEVIMDPYHDPKLRDFSAEDWSDFVKNLRCTTPDQPVVTQEMKLRSQGEYRWFRVIARAMWSSDEPPQYTGVIGKVVDVQESKVKMESLQRMASHDSLTDLLNLSSARKRIEEEMDIEPDADYALAVFDLDRFKQANDNYGHSFGNEVLVRVAEKLRQSLRSADIVARYGGDEFLIFLEYRQDLEGIIQRIFNTVSGENYKGFPISVSMGVAQTSVVGHDFNALFHAADMALYAVKNSGRGSFQIYDDSIEELPGQTQMMQ